MRGKKQERAQETENEEGDGREDISHSANWKHSSFFWSLLLRIAKTGRHLEGSALLALNGSEAYRSKLNMSGNEDQIWIL